MNPLLAYLRRGRHQRIGVSGTDEALIYFGGGQRTSLTSGEFWAAVDRYGNVISQRFGSGRRIGLLAPNSPQHLIASLGILDSGNCCTLLNPEWSDVVLGETLKTLGIDVVLCQDGDQDRVADTAIALSFTVIEATPSPPELDPGVPEQDSLIMFTSGSTGAPKAVPISGEGYAWTLGKFGFLVDELVNRRVFVSAPLFHMNAQFHSLMTLAYGGTLVLAERYDPMQTLTLILEEGLDRLTGVPTMFEQLLLAAARYSDAAPIEKDVAQDSSEQPITFPSVRSVAMGSSSAGPELFSRLAALFPGAGISNGFGTTETGPAIFGAHPDGLATPPGSIGFPMAGIEIKLVSEAGSHGAQPTSVSEVVSPSGELHVRSPMVARGYLNNPAASAGRFHDGWYRTGDLFRYDTDGFYYVIGRNDDMFNVGGHNLYPQEVEERLLGHPAVLQAAVVPKADKVKGAVPVAFVVTRDEVSFDEDSLRQFCIEHGSAWAHPRRVIELGALPLTAVNKLDRKQLTSDANQLEYRPPTND
ncbi:MAG: class I adenylate-forming enzyme family protein [Pseudomonadota bacterium]